MSEEIVTFDFIWECWKKNNYPDGFEDLLEKYLQIKAKIFLGDGVNITFIETEQVWVRKVCLSIDIGIQLNQQKFQWYKDYWKKWLQKDWVSSIEDRWISWI